MCSTKIKPTYVLSISRTTSLVIAPKVIENIPPSKIRNANNHTNPIAILSSKKNIKIPIAILTSAIGRVSFKPIKPLKIKLNPILLMINKCS